MQYVYSTFLWISNVQKRMIFSKTMQLKQSSPLRMLFSCCYLLCPHQTKTSDLYVLYKVTKPLFHGLSLSCIHCFTRIQSSKQQDFERNGLRYKRYRHLYHHIGWSIFIHLLYFSLSFFEQEYWVFLKVSLNTILLPIFVYICLHTSQYLRGKKTVPKN